MTVGTYVLGQVEVDHIVHILDVEPARGEIGGDEELSTSRTNGIECRTTLVAPLLPEQGNGLDPLKAQFFEGVCRIEAAPDKDKPPPDRQTPRQFLNSLYFITKRYNMIVVFMRIARPLHADEARREQLLCHPHGCRARCRREQEHLTVGGQEADHGAHLVQMLLAKQTVELVQNEQLHACEFQLAETVELLHARRRADNEGGLLLERFDLPLDVRPTDQSLHPDRQPCRLRQFTRDGCNLHRKLVRRREDERLCRTHGGGDALHDGQEVGERLARPRRCLADQILSCTRGRDERRLDLRRRSDATLCEGGDEMLGHTERCKVHSLLLGELLIIA